MASDKQSSKVTIGNVTGGIHGSIIAGRDVKDVTITLGGQPTPADKEPTLAELKQLLAEIQKQMAQIAAQKEALKAVSSAAPLVAQGAKEMVKDAAKKVEASADTKPEDAKSIQEGLTEATRLLSGILDRANTLVQKAVDVGKTVKPIAENLEPLVEKLAVAALWASRLWLVK